MADLAVGNIEAGTSGSRNMRYGGLTPEGWVQVGVLGALFAITFLVCLRRLWFKTNPITGDPNWSHSVCVPVVGLYYLYSHRKRLAIIPLRAAWDALPIIFGGLLVFAYGIWPGQNDFLKDFGMVVTLFGLTALLTGWKMMRILWFPICFLVCALPWPPLVYSAVALPLQELAARVAVAVLRMADVNAFFNGTKIFMEGYNGQLRTLNVAEACAGLRSLMTFITIGGAMAFLSSRPMWQKMIVTASAVPIAIFCNVMRVSGQGLLDHYGSHEWSEGFAHQLTGMVMLIPAFFLLLLMGWLLDRIFVEVAPIAMGDGAALSREAAAKMESQASVAGTPLYLPAPRSHGTVRRSKARIPGQAQVTSAEGADGSEPGGETSVRGGNEAKGGSTEVKL
jgi:exosortase